VEDVDPEANVEESVAAKSSDVGAEEFDTGNSNAEVGAESGVKAPKLYQ
jgi:hypothetical protein